MGGSHETTADLWAGRTVGIRFETMERLCTLLNCSLGDLFESTDDEQSTDESEADATDSPSLQEEKMEVSETTNGRPLANGLWNRLCEVCGSNEIAEIARNLGLSYHTVKNYTDGRLPAADVLIKIAEVTGVCLNWLLTGQGMQYIDSETSNYPHKAGVAHEIQASGNSLPITIRITIEGNRTEAKGDK